MATTVVVSYQPWHVSMVFPTWSIPLNTDAGTDNITGLTASNISLYFRDTTTTPPIDTPGTGTLTIQTSNPASILYQPSTTDVASTFTGQIVIKAKFGPSFDNTTLTEYDGIPFVISY